MKVLLSVLICILAAIISPDISHQIDPSDDMGKIEQNNSTSSNSEYKDPVATPEDAKKLVKEAIEYLDMYGKSKAFEEFSNKSGKFCYKDTYIFAIDMNGNVLAHGGDTELIGTNQYKLKDSVGKYFIQEFIILMNEKDTGWIEYKWRNYESFEIESKLTYLKKYDNNLFLGCGIYYGN